MDSWLNMALLCGLLLIASLQTTNALRFRRSKSNTIQTLNTKIQHLQAHYKTKGKEWYGKTIFLSHLDQLNSKASCTCQGLLLERMLKIYEEIFQEMLNKSKEKEVTVNTNDVMTEAKRSGETEVTANLNYIITVVNNLKKKYSEEHKVWRELQDIHSVKVENETIQGGALLDFLMVFDQASREKQVQ
ncbi:interferon gamma related [Puntigrus tetrazona]|uniref:interferon gamma related n=1 Tax=Puntigrus tetrazona TaxID=1606681 RepID=UPI001C896083|nr:interferon gamma related [Puntigrus tetrazona]